MRVFLLVLDSFGVGESPDAKKYGDEGSHTYNSVTNNKYCKIPTLTKLGLTNIDGLAPKTISDCDYTVKIPMYHGVDSLNVAAASAVAFWQLQNRGE